MDFGHSAVEQTFADEVRAFLRAHPPDTFPPDGTDAGYGSGAPPPALTPPPRQRRWLRPATPPAPRSRGLSMLMVDNGLPGLELRPIRSLTGQVYHYEVFMDAVRVPREWVLGKPGEGFGQLLHGLDTDRFWGRFYKAPFLRRILGLLVEYVRAERPNDLVARHPLAHAAIQIAALRALFHRAAWLIEQGQDATGPVSAAKVMADELGQRVLSLGMELLGPYGVLRAGSRWARLRGEIEHQYQTSWGHTLAGGTSEIQRTTIAVRALGLPAEPRGRG